MSTNCAITCNEPVEVMLSTEKWLNETNADHAAAALCSLLEQRYQELSNDIDARATSFLQSKDKLKQMELHSINETSTIETRDFRTLDADLSTSITRLNGAIAEESAKQLCLQKQLEESQRDIAKAKESFAALDVSLAQGRQRVAALQTSLAEINEEIANTQRDANQVWSSLTSGVATEYTADIERLTSRKAQLQGEYKVAERRRREVYNDIQELKGNLRVYCRIKPSLPGEVGGLAVGLVDDMTVEVVDPDTDRTSTFEFDLILAPSVRQEDIFEEVRPLATSVLDGFNVCIFAYGQTGSGKTYTMEGPKEDRGVNYRTVKELFLVAEGRNRDWDTSLSVSVLEIYNDKVFDLSGGRVMSKLRWGGDDVGVVVEPLSKSQVHSVDDVQNTLEAAYRNRSVAGTDANQHSSRSHCIVTVYVQARNKVSNMALHAKLHLIDLAGSERVKQSKVEGDRLKEATHINSSLSYLKSVIQSLANKSGFVPYRNSSLTALLQDSLGGNCKCLMFANVSGLPAHLPETICTMKYAADARRVERGRATANVKAAS